MMKRDYPMVATIRETAKITGCAESYLRKRVKNKEIQGYKSGNRFMIIVDKLIEQLEAEATKELGVCY